MELILYIIQKIIYLNNFNILKNTFQNLKDNNKINLTKEFANFDLQLNQFKKSYNKNIKIDNQFFIEYFYNPLKKLYKELSLQVSLEKNYIYDKKLNKIIDKKPYIYNEKLDEIIESEGLKNFILSNNQLIKLEDATCEDMENLINLIKTENDQIKSFYEEEKISINNVLCLEKELYTDVYWYFINDIFKEDNQNILKTCMDSIIFDNTSYKINSKKLLDHKFYINLPIEAKDKIQKNI